MGRQVKYPASTWWWYDWAIGTLRLYGSPKRGDIFVWSTPQGGHMGIVAQVFPDGSFRTIEGNSNDAGDREGYEVAERIRTGLPNHKRRGFIRLEGVKW
jgi:surface antigen